MKITLNDIRNKLSEKGLKVTPQRIAILEAIYTLDNHPTADNIIESVRKRIRILLQELYIKCLILLLSMS